MSVFRLVAPTLLVLAAACGGDEVVVRGSLHPSLLGGGEGGAWTVWAEEAEREARVDGGRFELKDLAPGPVHLQLRREGREVGRIAIPTLGVGMTLGLDGLRVDERSRLAFPSEVELEGASTVYVNGIRMGPASAVPDSVDVTGTVLSLQPRAGVMLFRPGDGKLPDLRVVLGPAAGPLTVEDLAAGDSVRIAGRRAGNAVAVSLVEPAGGDDAPNGDVGETPPPGEPASFDSGSGASDAEEGDAGPARETSVAATPPVMAPVPGVGLRGMTPGRGEDGSGRGRGRGQGKNREGRG
jgi:hypothetical protein